MFPLHGGGALQEQILRMLNRVDEKTTKDISMLADLNDILLYKSSKIED